MVDKERDRWKDAHADVPQAGALGRPGVIQAPAGRWAWHGGLGWAGQGMAWHGRAGQGRAGQGRAKRVSRRRRGAGRAFRTSPCRCTPPPGGCARCACCPRLRGRKEGAGGRAGNECVRARYLCSASAVTSLGRTLCPQMPSP
jgi:hypothetical protein